MSVEYLELSRHPLLFQLLMHCKCKCFHVIDQLKLLFDAASQARTDVAMTEELNDNDSLGALQDYALVVSILTRFHFTATLIPIF